MGFRHDVMIVGVRCLEMEWELMIWWRSVRASVVFLADFVVVCTVLYCTALSSVLFLTSFLHEKASFFQDGNNAKVSIFKGH